MSAEQVPEDQVDSVLGDYIADIEGEERLEVDVDGRRHTVELRPIYDFEKSILDDLIETGSDTSVTGGAVPIKGEWIHGWLRVNTDDYINNIWKNYQFFVKYIEAKTSAINNISTFNRSPGTYDSMYRYLLVLEDLGLLDRYKQEQVPKSEYDFPVPPEFRTRTFIRLESDFESRKDDWNNPYGARYPDGEKPEDEDKGEVEGVDIQPEDLEGETGLAGFQPSETDEEDEQDEGEEIEVEPTESGLGQFTGDDDTGDTSPESMPDENASIDDFGNPGAVHDLIEDSFPQAMEQTFEDAPIPAVQASPGDFSVGRSAVVSDWATGNADTGEMVLELVVSIDDTNAQLSPGFIPSGIQEHLPTVMKDNNPYADVFPTYSVVACFNSVFKRRVDEVVRNEQTELVYYRLDQEEYKEL